MPSPNIARKTVAAILTCLSLGACRGDPTDVPSPSRVEISPAEATLAAIGATQQLSALARDEGGSSIRGLRFSWKTSDAAVATVDQTGRVTAVANGTATIKATTGAVTGSAQVTVRQHVSRIIVSPLEAYAVIGDTVQLSARARDSNGHAVAGAQLTWLSSETAVAAIVAAGRARAVEIGTTSVTASADGSSGSMVLTVVARLEAIEIEPPHGVLYAIGDTLRMVAIALEAAGHRLSGTRFIWASTEPGVATLDSFGLVTARGPGESTISAEADGVTGRAQVTVAVVPFAQLTAGFQHSCAATPDGAAYCWGANGGGRLGDGTSREQSAVPVPVQGDYGFRALSAGQEHTCGITTTGKAYCWGEGGSGQLGEGTTGFSHTPRPVLEDDGFISISAGYLHTCGVIESGQAYCWGYALFGQLGDGNLAYSRTAPVPVAGELEFVEVEVGRYHSCGLTPEGDAYCWGYNGDGQLGDTTAIPESKTPVRVMGGHQFIAISASRAHTCGVEAGGAAYCWGWNGDGRLGIGTTEPSAFPVRVAGGREFRSVSAGDSHTCGLSTVGIAYCWGANTDGQLGDGTRTSKTSPVPVAGGHRFVRLSTGGSHTCGFATDGATYCWGKNRSGQLGDATQTSSPLPVRVAAP